MLTKFDPKTKVKVQVYKPDAVKRFVLFKAEYIKQSTRYVWFSTSLGVFRYHKETFELVKTGDKELSCSLRYV